MAVPAQSGQRLTLAASNTVQLAAPSASFVGTWIVQLESSSFNGTIDVQGRCIKAAAADFLNIDYRIRTSGNTDVAVTQLDHTDVGSGLILEINAAGLDVQLVVERNSGSLLIDVHPLIG